MFALDSEIYPDRLSENFLDGLKVESKRKSTIFFSYFPLPLPLPRLNPTYFRTDFIWFFFFFVLLIDGGDSTLIVGLQICNLLTWPRSVNLRIYSL